MEEGFFLPEEIVVHHMAYMPDGWCVCRIKNRIKEIPFFISMDSITNGRFRYLVFSHEWGSGLAL